jgi:hypothetical protein
LSSIATRVPRRAPVRLRARARRRAALTIAERRDALHAVYTVAKHRRPFVPELAGGAA